MSKNKRTNDQEISAPSKGKVDLPRTKDVIIEEMKNKIMQEISDRIDTSIKVAIQGALSNWMQGNSLSTQEDLSTTLMEAEAADHERAQPTAVPDNMNAPAKANPTWSAVVKRRPKKKGPPEETQKQAENDRNKKTGSPDDAVNRKPRRTRNSVAVTVRINDEKSISYAEALAEARKRINIKELDIQNLRYKRAISGAVILEIPGRENASKASALAEKMRTILEGRGVTIRCPVVTREILLNGLDESLTTAEIQTTLASEGNCDPKDIITGKLRKLRSGTTSMWCKCPESTAEKLLQKGRIILGWSTARVQELPQKPQQCFSCWSFGHIGAMCSNKNVRRQNWCFRCGAPDHNTAACGATSPHCLICVQNNLQANHRMGGAACKSAQNFIEKKSKQKTRKETTGQKKTKNQETHPAPEDVSHPLEDDPGGTESVPLTAKDASHTIEGGQASLSESIMTLQQCTVDANV